MNYPDIFSMDINVHPDFRMCCRTLISLWNIAIFYDLVELEKNCIAVVNSRVKMINENINKLYNDRKVSKEQIFKNVLNGKTEMDLDISQQFLKECYNFGMTYNRCGVILNIIPYYLMTDDELAMFTLAPAKSIRLHNAVECQLDRMKRFEEGIANPEAIKVFLGFFKKNPSLSSAKFLHRLVQLFFTD